MPTPSSSARGGDDGRDGALPHLHEPWGDVASRPLDRDHAVQFYDDDEFLIEAVARFVGAGLAVQDRVIVVATPSHLDALEERLADSAFDLDWACDTGQLTLLDAYETLSTFVVDGRPDPERFNAAVAPLLEQGRQGRGGRPLRAFGEMVDVLCQEDNHEGAVALEEMWNQVAARFPMSLFCGYRMRSFSKAEHSDPFLQVCQAHGRVLPAERSPHLASDDAWQREICLLRQRALALESEIERRKRAERAAEEAQRQVQALRERLSSIARS